MPIFQFSGIWQKKIRILSPFAIRKHFRDTIEKKLYWAYHTKSKSGVYCCTKSRTFQIRKKVFCIFPKQTAATILGDLSSGTKPFFTMTRGCWAWKKLLGWQILTCKNLLHSNYTEFIAHFVQWQITCNCWYISADTDESMKSGIDPI